jgi:Flp pilus assembly protein TadG
MRRPDARMTRRRRSVGQAMVEFALVAPLFFFLLFAIIDFGRYVYYVQILNNAAREGARYAIVHGSSSLAPSGPPASSTSSVHGHVDVAHRKRQPR